MAKRSGVTEPFNRDKIVRGVRRACQGRPVSEDQLALLAQQVEDVIRSRGSGEIPSHEVGLAILGPLRDLDEVAYLRFASVYRGLRVAERLRARDRGAARCASGWTGAPRMRSSSPTEAELRPEGERGTGPGPSAGNRAR